MDTLLKKSDKNSNQSNCDTNQRDLGRHMHCRIGRIDIPEQLAEPSSFLNGEIKVSAFFDAKLMADIERYVDRSFVVMSKDQGEE